MKESWPFQQPHARFQAFLVPSDYASDVPKDWWAQVVAPVPVGITQTVPKPPPGAAYRLISMLELNRFMTQVPAGASGGSRSLRLA